MGALSCTRILEDAVSKASAIALPLLAAALAAGTGCVHAYQPMAGLNGPVVIDTGAQNFPDLQLQIVCNQGDLLNRQEAAVLCQNAATLFRNQGATVTTRIGNERSYGGAQQESDSEQRVDLSLELTSREVHTFNDPVMWTLCVLTCSVVPAMSESSFALDVVIRDGTGFLLATETLEGRIIERVGVGIWALNMALDVLRSDYEKMAEDAAKQDLSNDLYGQLSQLVFNAQSQWEVLQELPPVER
ncbi:MAG: hypothetical protein VX899_06230 [Myxococcota bacterium]|nr:hypothetical protein [Myxococcota bacterium]